MEKYKRVITPYINSDPPLSAPPPLEEESYQKYFKTSIVRASDLIFSNGNPSSKNLCMFYSTLNLPTLWDMDVQEDQICVSSRKYDQIICTYCCCKLVSIINHFSRNILRGYMLSLADACTWRRLIDYYLLVFIPILVILETGNSC